MWCFSLWPRATAKATSSPSFGERGKDPNGTGLSSNPGPAPGFLHRPLWASVSSSIKARSGCTGDDTGRGRGRSRRKQLETVFPQSSGLGNLSPGRTTNPGSPIISRPRLTPQGPSSQSVHAGGPQRCLLEKGSQAHLAHLSLEPQPLNRQGREDLRDTRLSARPT